MNPEMLKKLREFFLGLSQTQKIAAFGITAVAILSLVFLFVWANRPEYGLLYSSLSPEDASQIVDDLKSNHIPYQLKNGGTTILVPKKQIYELRLKYAGENIIRSGAVGYELFDKNNLGLTDFMQRVNLKRALEGELANTINQIEAVVQSRVHLVLPEESLFEEDKKEATASVILKVRPRTTLDHKQVMGIASLVAGSVEGLKPENVIIVDTFGNILSSNEKRETDIGLSSSQYELQQKVEQYLSRKAQTMLDRVLGPNNAIVRVNAQLNFEKLKRTIQKVDPDNVAVLSEERNEERSTDPDTTLYQRENTITNYELNKVVEEFQGSYGDIKRLSVAVFVNGVPSGEGESQTVQPRSEEEIQKITEIVKTAVGFREDRNDQVVVQQLTFDRTTLEQEKEVMTALEKKEQRDQYIKLGLTVLSVLFVLFMLKTFFKKVGFEEYLSKQKTLLLSEAPRKVDRLVGEPEVDEMRKLAQDTKQRQLAQEQITRQVQEFAEKDTERAARILRYWLLEEDNE
ncbi:MAG: flagellar M-ring protein FliF [Calditrichaeota bacterium]|nr:MAG: flagellar M-ring protein FliF [Calditrichota bacterium]